MTHFPEQIRSFPKFDGVHAARFDKDTSEIEFWLRRREPVA